ncbi:hypothetical protein QO179_23485 [Bacillus stercoris]|nr:hypothetical protein [Bacillus stercoris]
MIKYHDCYGIAGDSLALLVGELNGKREYVSYNRAYFPEWNRKRAMKKIARRFKDAQKSI